MLVMSAFGRKAERRELGREQTGSFRIDERATRNSRKRQLSGHYDSEPSNVSQFLSASRLLVISSQVDSSVTLQTGLGYVGCVRIAIGEPTNSEAENSSSKITAPQFFGSLPRSMNIDAIRPSAAPNQHKPTVRNA